METVTQVRATRAARKRQPTEAQKTAAAERRAKMREFAKRVSAMTPAEREALAGRFGVVTIEGRALSPYNACMIWIQYPSATIVGGFRQWLKAGRCVRKGEHGQAIWVPISPAKASEAADHPTGDESADGCRFVLGTVFDIAQTDAAESAGAA